MKHLFYVTLILITVLITKTGFPQGIYVGAGIGGTFYSSEVQDALNQIKEINENSVAWKIFGGYHITDFLNIEGGYRSFESISSTLGSNVFESKTTGWDIEAMGRLKIFILDAFAKAGVMFWSTETNFLGISTDESGTDFLWGMGAGAHLGPVGVRLEWESVLISGPTNISTLSLSGTIGF